MANPFTHKAKRLTEADVAQAEAKLGFELPPDLRKHYLAQNGGQPRRKSYRSATGLECGVGAFFPMKYASYEGEPLLEDLYVEFSKKKKVLKKDLVPFAEDEGGDFFCIHRKTQEIHYCLLNQSNPKTANRKVAPSLSAFIDGMLTEREFYKRDKSRSLAPRRRARRNVVAI